MLSLSKVFKNIDADAVEVVNKLQKSGFTTYFVGGCVRDLLLGLNPKDFDIVTDATPRKVKEIIRNSFIIGKRFRLVLVKKNRNQYEVSTFRQDPEDLEDLTKSDNTFGTPEQDANRRDLTINSIFYDPIKQKIIDYTKGVEDIKKRVIRMIGDPRVRLEEDPIRILRALRFAEKLSFTIDHDLRKAIEDFSHQLPNANLSRIREEILKILKLENPKAVFLEALDLKVLKYISPTLHRAMKNKKSIEEFMIYLDNINQLDNTNPKELFAYLTLAFITTFKGYNPDAKISKGSIIRDEELIGFMKSEMGMFPSEISQICNSLEILYMLKEPKKHTDNLKKEIGFQIALKFARQEYITSLSN